MCYVNPSHPLGYVVSSSTVPNTATYPGWIPTFGWTQASTPPPPLDDDTARRIAKAIIAELAAAQTPPVTISFHIDPQGIINAVYRNPDPKR